MYISGRETRQCPPQFQERLTRKFGRNQFGEPHFKIVWNQSQFIRLGREDKDKYGRRVHYYRDCYQGDANPCWMIMCWKPPSHYGSPETYYANTWIPLKTAGEDSAERADGRGYDSPEGFYVTAEYPYKGRYEIVVPLMHKEFVDNKLKIEHMPLSHYLIDVIIPLILAWQELTQEEKEAAQYAEAEAEAARENAELTERMMDSLPAWYGPVSFSRQGCRTSLLDQKMHAIQKHWDQLARNGLRPVFQTGLTQGDRPLVSRYR